MTMSPIKEEQNMTKSPEQEAADTFEETVRKETRRQVRAVVRAASIVVGLITVCVVGATACGAKYQEPYKDAPTTGKHIRTAWTVIEAPDGFSNQATSCLVLPDGTKPGIRLFSAYHGDHAYGAISSVADDTCK